MMTLLVKSRVDDFVFAISSFVFLNGHGIELYVNFHQDRGLDDRKLLPYFPFRDDGFKILKVIEAMVKDYVNL